MSAWARWRRRRSAHINIPPCELCQDAARTKGFVHASIEDTTPDYLTALADAVGVLEVNGPTSRPYILEQSDIDALASEVDQLVGRVKALRAALPRQPTTEVENHA